MKENSVIEVIEFTDPVCTWCWGSEPILRKLETRYGNQIKIRYVMGGLVQDIRQFYDSFNDIGGDPERSNAQIAKHWLEASERHGMPVRSEGFRLFTSDYPSTYPQNIAYKAAQMESVELADRFLRRIREASAAEAKLTSSEEVLISLASEVGLDVAKFIERLSNGTAEKAFHEDLKMVQAYGSRGFPSFLVRYGETELLLRGYQRYETFQALIARLSEGRIVEHIPSPTKEEVLAFIRKYGTVAPIEVKEAFELSDADLKSTIDSLVAEQSIDVRQAGNGVFYSPRKDPLACDPVTGTCDSQ